MEQDKIHNELKDLAPFLSGIPKENRFAVPKNYFEEFPSKVRDKVGYSPSPAWENVRKYLVPKFSPTWAALAFLLVLGVFLIWKNNQNPNLAINHKPVSTNEYILDQIDEDIILDEIAMKEDKS